MNNQSLFSFNKISAQMDRLSNLFNKQQIFHQQIHKVLNDNDISQQSSSERSLENIDNYFKEYDNPTTKSLPFQEQNSSNAQNYEQPTEIIDTVYRDTVNQQNEDGDRDNIHDDKSTVILLSPNYHHKKQKEHIQNFQIAKSLANYNSLKIENKSLKKDAFLNKSKKINTKNAGLSSMPSEVYPNYDKLINVKNESISKHNQIQSPNVTQTKFKKSNGAEGQNYLIKQLKNKLSKISKIDKDELTKLQQKKHSKKTELSSNRKKTKRQLNKAKSSSNMKNNVNKTNYTSSNKFTANKTIGNQSVKHFQNKKHEAIKKPQEKIMSHYDWQKNNEKLSSNNKKLNRINIGRLQQNMKKINEKKYNAIKQLGKKLQKTKEKKHDKQIAHKDPQLKLFFTDENQQSQMAQMIKEKHLGKQYSKQTQRYNQTSKKMSKEYFSTLIKECRQTSQQAILKLKLVALLIYFYDQFAKTPFTANCNIPLKHHNFFTYISQQQIIQILLHPTKLIKIIQNLPYILITDNIISSERFEIFIQKFGQINDQLDQQLQFFLIKKSNLYMFIHCLSQYMNFLLEKQLIGKTKRNKVVQGENIQIINGFYSSRSKKDDFSKKYIKKNEGPHKLGYRCDSDRKITFDDEQIIFKMPVKTLSKPQFQHKTNPLKKIFK